MYRGRASNSSRGLRPPRASWSGLGRGRGRGSSWRKDNEPSSKATVDDIPLGRLITNISLGDALGHDIKAEDAKISDCKYAASYSIVDSRSPKIIIPGQPATWKPPQLPSQLPGDHGDYLRDQNGARFPEHPMQPSVQSLFALNKEFDPLSIHIMGCASSLGDILRFTRAVEATFRFDVEMIGNTLFLVRNHRDQIIPDVRGYGHSFLDNFTSYPAGVEETKSHQRVVSYSFGGLKFLVRFECDGHSTNNAEGVVPTLIAPKAVTLQEPSVSSSIAIKPAGVIVPQDSILEIKTKSQARAPIEMSDHLPRLWVRQIPHLITAYHTRGSFEDVQEKAVRVDVLKWEAEHESELRKFASVLHQLINEVKRASQLKLELYRAGSGPLELRERSGKTPDALPADWKDMWIGSYQGPGRDGEGHSSDEEDGGSCPSLAFRGGESSESEGSDDDIALDYTACDLNDCGYCGRCAY
ncbi:hypothetical protein F4677DRAFT_329607 [Hypoxylon crocopeplum]|nr:hypothetical protein F4677DRAFT_329607 [Hypoxylon crocopeplum]